MKRPKLTLILLTILSFLLIVGCVKEEQKPVAIKVDTDKCDICHMAIKDNQFASEIILENGKEMVFDDVGCMYKWIKENKGEKIANAYVKDYQSKEWIEAEKATFVYDKPIKTPMAYNVISFTDKKDAQGFVEENGGKLLNYDNLEDHSWERNAEMVKEMKENMQKMNGDKDNMNMKGDTDNMDMDKSEDSH